MDYAIVKVPVAPIRRKPRHQSEMTNQLLFGDAVKVLKEKNELWIKVRCLSDQYEGWITSHMLQEVSSEQAKAPSRYVTGAMMNTIEVEDRRLLVPAGASLPLFDGAEGRIGQMSYRFQGSFLGIEGQVFAPEKLKEFAFAWLNAPYLWGGKTIFGVDCSGFVQVNFKMIGMQLPRDAWQQAQEGKLVDGLKQAECGDLAFFDDKDEIVHVGILLDSERIIHASGMVRIDQIDKKGIIHSGTGKRTHSLRVIKRCR